MPRPPPLIDVIPSPPLVPGDGPIDVAHLSRMTLGDAGLAREVLVMFVKQTAQLLTSLATKPPNAAALAHTLKGSARAVGAFGVAAAHLSHAIVMKPLSRAAFSLQGDM